MTVLLILIIILACIVASVRFHEPFQESSNTIMQTNWSCQKILSSGKPSYVISRKNMNGEPECVSFDKTGDKKDRDGKCSMFEDHVACRTAMQNAATLKPNTCTKDEYTKDDSTCAQLRETIWQCRNVGNNIVYALRRNQKKDIECMGYSYEACTPFQGLLQCTDSVGMIDNDKHLACGKMMYDMFGTDGYSKEGHYCKTLKNDII